MLIRLDSPIVTNNLHTQTSTDCWHSIAATMSSLWILQYVNASLLNLLYFCVTAIFSFCLVILSSSHQTYLNFSILVMQYLFSWYKINPKSTIAPILRGAKLTRFRTIIQDIALSSVYEIFSCSIQDDWLQIHRRFLVSFMKQTKHPSLSHYFD